MYAEHIKTPDVAVSHLFLHCCLKDGSFQDDELQLISARVTSLGLHENINFKKEVIAYNYYKNDIADETAYIQYLVNVLTPVNELALYSYCMELFLANALFDTAEQKLAVILAEALNISAEEVATVQKLFLQRKVCESEHLV